MGGITETISKRKREGSDSRQIVPPYFKASRTAKPHRGKGLTLGRRGDAFLNGGLNSRYCHQKIVGGLGGKAVIYRRLESQKGGGLGCKTEGLTCSTHPKEGANDGEGKIAGSSDFVGLLQMLREARNKGGQGKCGKKDK